MIIYTNGAGTLTTNIYYPNSRRLKQVKASIGGTNHQDLTYTFDKVSNLKGITDGVYPSGSASASLSSIGYDDLHRVTSLTSTARGDKSYSYDSIGNTLVNQDYGGGTYTYGTKPHAVTNANGKTYTYDACGNMVTRGSQTLTYDEQNQLVRVSTGGTNVIFGYTEGGERLWRAGTNGYTVWIGGIYELNNGKVLCHVFAGGQRIATFEPRCGSWAANVIGEERWYAATTAITAAMNWPFQKGRTPFTVLTLTFLGILAVCVMARQPVPVKRRVRRRLVPVSRDWTQGVKVARQRRVKAVRPTADFVARERVWKPALLSKQAVTFISIAALMLATTPQAQAATYHPVFYYYQGDHLGSSSVLTDRAGERVQHYEYTAFGNEGFKENSSAFEISHRYTGQILDDETGLYYYGARYYDPELGRFVQADTIVPSAANPQTLNRYAYCGNNPLKYVDPSGHELITATAIIVGVIIGAAVGGATAAATGGNIGMGILTGAIGGLFGGIGAGVGQAIGSASCAIGTSLGTFGGAVVGGAVGGAVSAAVVGGDPGIGALTGAIAGGIGFAVGNLTQGFVKGLGVQDTGWGELAELGGSSLGGAAGGGIGAELQGGDFWQGAAYGAAGGAIGYSLAYFLKFNNGPLKAGDRNLFHHAAQLLGKIWNLPNTIVGLVWGGIGMLGGAKPILGDNGIEFEKHWFHSKIAPNRVAALTLGNTISFRGIAFEWADHEVWHTYQGQQLGPLYLPSNILGQMLTVSIDIFSTKLNYYQATQRYNWNERGPYDQNPTPWK